MLVFSVVGLNKVPEYNKNLRECIFAHGNVGALRAIVMPEPTNRFDPNALQVILYNQQENKPIGYIAKADHETIRTYKPEVFKAGASATVLEVGEIWKEGNTNFMYCKILV